MQIRRIAALLALGWLLSGCNAGGGSGVGAGGGATPGNGQQTNRQQAGASLERTPVQAFAAARPELIDRPNTAFQSMPTTGQARFEGAAELQVLPDAGQVRRYVGAADLTVDFGRAALVGLVDGFVARGNAAPVAGQILITEGQIGAERPNGFTARYAGGLRHNGDQVSVDSTLRGDFRGTPIQGVVARGAGDDARLNGVATDYTFDLFATGS